MHSSGKTPMAGNLNMNGSKIYNLTNPTDHRDAANKAYVDSNFLKVTGGSMSGNLNMGGSAIMGLEDPTSTSQAATKRYIDNTVTHATSNKLPLAGGTMSGDINMGGHKITNITLPSAITSNHNGYAVNLGYVNGVFVKRDGSSKLTGNLDTNGNKVINLADPVDDGDAVSKKYMELHTSSSIRSDSHGNIDLNGGRVMRIGSAVDGKDAISRDWAKLNVSQRYLPKSYLWELMQTADCVYKLDRANTSEIQTVTNGNTTEVVRL